MDKNFIWSAIVEPIINLLTDNAIDKFKSGIDDIRKEKF